MDNSFAMQIIKKLITCIIILVILLFASNLAWLYAWCQYDYESIDVSQDTSSEGDCNYIGEEGTINYGETDYSDSEENEEEYSGSEENNTGYSQEKGLENEEA